MKNKDFEERLTDIYIVNDNLTDEELITELNEKKMVSKKDMGGTLEKTFKVVDDDMNRPEDPYFLEGKTVQDSRFFPELFSSLQGEDCYYFTYLNELFEDKENIYIPHSVYCVIKDKTHLGALGAYSEETSPKIANILGVSTVYNKAIKIEDKPFESVLSVSCIPNNYSLVDFEEYDEVFTRTMPLELSLKALVNLLNKISVNHKTGLKLTSTNIQSAKEEFVRQYLLRSVLFADVDFKSKNCGVLYNNEGDFQLAPIFDLEYMLHINDRSIYRIKLEVAESIHYCQEYFPKVLDEFMIRLEKSVNDESIFKVLDTNLAVDKEKLEMIKKNLFISSRIMIDYWHEHMADNWFKSHGIEVL